MKDFINGCTLCEGVDKETEKQYYVGDSDKDIVIVYELGNEPNWDVMRSIVGEDFVAVPNYRCDSATNKSEALNNCFVFNYVLMRSKNILVVCSDYPFNVVDQPFKHGSVVFDTKNPWHYVVQMDWDTVKGNKDERKRFEEIFDRIRKSL